MMVCSSVLHRASLASLTRGWSGPASKVGADAKVAGPAAQRQAVSRINVMTSSERTVTCGEHGLQQEAFVCQHIVQGLHENVPCGFWWAEDPSSPRPDAWC